MADPQMVYDSGDGVTHIWKDGKYIGQQKGKVNDLSKLTAFISGAMGAPSSMSEAIADEKQIPWKQVGKDIAVDAATQLPLALIGMGGGGKTALRAGSSFLSGLIADKLLNSDKDTSTSAIDAGSNTLLSMGIPGLMENSVSRKPGKTNSFGAISKLIDLINPANYEVTKRTNMVNLPQRGTRTGQFGKAQPTPVPVNVGKTIQQFLLKKLGLNSSPELMRNLLGLGINTGYDTTLNRSKEE